MKEQTSFLTLEEISELGLKEVGRNVLISRYARLYSPDKISIGNNVRIDDFCILSGNLTIGSNVHISSHVALFGAEGIIIEDYSGISSNSLVYSAMDDFSGNYLIGPIHPKEYTHVTGGIVKIEKYVQIGANCVIFPNLTIGEGSVIGACSQVRHNVGEWGVYYGTPVKRYKDREKGLLNYAEKYL